ncbi:hypothetical protein GJR95_41115 [Spirosoma endbachense]|uniref:Uncharacterized protein n=2 Tax=Spirosoma endbachense TaxID=2666025 RepID=A0A6P1WCC7_9BACT|nr:hypothetical protein GJR95_41115 [Spirosoma endbachense]
MKSIAIRFFSPQDNIVSSPKTEKATKTKNRTLTGYISPIGKLVFPAKTVADLGIDFDNTQFKVGMPDGKRKAKSLYLVPGADSQQDTFQFEKAAKSYTLSLSFILTKSGVDFSTNKYTFVIDLFDYEGSPAFVLQLSQDKGSPKAAYTGKPRGRKPKVKVVAE